MYANPGPHSYVLVQTHSHWHTHTHTIHACHKKGQIWCTGTQQKFQGYEKIIFALKAFCTTIFVTNPLKIPSYFVMIWTSYFDL
jgi:hypothetical protein